MRKYWGSYFTRSPPVALQPSLGHYYARVNEKWRKGYEVQTSRTGRYVSDPPLSRIVVVSISGGFHDYQVFVVFFFFFFLYLVMWLLLYCGPLLIFMTTLHFLSSSVSCAVITAVLLWSLQLACKSSSFLWEYFHICWWNHFLANWSPRMCRLPWKRFYWLR